jgi:hypothetical protein
MNSSYLCCGCVEGGTSLTGACTSCERYPQYVIIGPIYNCLYRQRSKCQELRERCRFGANPFNLPPTIKLAIIPPLPLPSEISR